MENYYKVVHYYEDYAVYAYAMVASSYEEAKELVILNETEDLIDEEKRKYLKNGYMTICILGEDHGYKHYYHTIDDSILEVTKTEPYHK